MHRMHANSLPLPAPDYDDPKEIYAFCGLAVYYVQLLEHSLRCLAAVLRLAGPGLLTQEEFDRIGVWLDGHTLGQLLKATGHIDSHRGHDLCHRAYAISTNEPPCLQDHKGYSS